MSTPVSMLDDEHIRLEYRLADLPTAQHKAGLAGLVLLIRNLEERGVEPRPVLVRVDAHAATIELDEAGLRGLFDDLYDGYWTEASYGSKLQNKEPKRIEEIEKEVAGKTKKEKRFIYDDFRPRGALFRHLLKGGEQDPWLKLWQDMLWAVLRAQPKTREEYKRRAEKEQATITAQLWPKLLKAGEKRGKGKPITDSIAGSIFVGAQDKNAERVVFQGLVEQNLLLHFWPLVAPIFVPRSVDIKNKRRTDQGYLLAIPEVADLEFFVEEIREYWKSLDPKVQGYRPAACFIDVPEEASLELLFQLSEQRIRKGYSGLAGELLAIEWYHQEKQGNNVRMHGQGRLLLDMGMLNEYSRIRDHNGNPLFKSLLIRNLLDDRDWFAGAQTLFGAYPAEFFIQSPGSPRFCPFGLDAGRYFRDRIIPVINQQEKTGMTEDIDSHARLARRIYRLIGAYVRHRTDERSKIKEKDLPKNEKEQTLYPKEFREAREKVTKDAFLAMRGRNDRDFIEYFTGTICSVPQFFSKEHEGQEFIEVSRALIKTPEIVKNLSMLALSAWSWLPGAKEESATNPTENKE